MEQTYYIYHIPGVKIGCTTEPEKRIKDQGYTDYEILEQYEDGWVAGGRERELQAEYGYEVDNSHYMISRQNWAEGGKISGKINGKIQGRKNVESGHISNLGKIQGRKAVESGQLASVASKGGKIGGKKAANIVRTCPHCNKTIKGPSYFQWHGDKCKHKK